MFVWRADVFLDQLRQRRPDVAEPIHRIAAAWDSASRDSVLGAVWPTVPKVAVEYAVMEPASLDGLVSTVPGDFGWSDIGDFETVGTLLGREESGVTVVGGTSSVAAGGSSVVSIDSDGVIVVPTEGRLVALLDVHDLVVVDTPDAVVVCRRDRVQDVKKLTELLREHGRDDYV
jgi:mannose-1-phosphate guanylyltransferase